MRWLYLLLICFFLLVACEKGHQQLADKETNALPTGNASVKERLSLVDAVDNAPVSTQPALRLLPAQPKTTDSLSAQLSGCKGRPVYSWYLNGQQLEQQTSAHLAADVYKKHDRVLVKSQCGTIELEAGTTIANTPPRITTLQFKGPGFGTGIPLVVEAQGQDADGDDLSFSFRWQIDGQELSSPTDNLLPGNQVRKGQSIILTAIPADGESQGMPQVSAAFVVPNSAPRFTSQPSANFQAQTYEYLPAVVDPDGDAVVFSLAAAPAAMQIDSATGRIRCPVAEIVGSAKVTLVATDVDGLQAQQTFTISMN